MKKVLITGAAGNLGNLLANYLAKESLHLNLMYHHKQINADLSNRDNVSVFKADLSDRSTIMKSFEGVDTVIHFAGVLFKSNPEKFLPTTNTQYFRNLTEVAIEKNVRRVILVSFPHVEGETFPDKPAKGILDGNPTSVHARTRLEEERILFENEDKFEAVSLRVGMVYGKGILMIDAAKWFAKHKLLGIWKKPTWIHLISKDDYLEATKNSIVKNNISGIYHLGDEGTQTLQEFFDDAATHWGYRKPIRMSQNLIFFAARLFEFYSRLFNTRSPLTRDFIRIGMVSYYGDTSRMRSELLEYLKYRTYKEGIETL